MRTKDIRQWVSVSSNNSSVGSPYDDDDEMKPDGRDEPGHDELSSMQDWDTFLAGVDKRLRSPSTRDRRHVLEERLGTLAAQEGSLLSPAQRSELLVLLLATYARYQDKESRAAAQKVAAQCILGEEPRSKESITLATAIDWLQAEVERVCRPTKDGYFPSSSLQRANLVSWASLLLHTAVRLLRQADASCSSVAGWPRLVTAVAQAYDAVAIDMQLKPALARNAAAAVRRSVRTSHTAIPDLLNVLTSVASVRNAALLGLVLDVCLRLRAGAETSKGSEGGQGKRYIRDAKQVVLHYYLTYIVSSKISLPQHTYGAFHDFIATEVGEEDLTTMLRPGMEKMMLRSPEIAIPPIKSFFEAYASSCSSHLIALRPLILSAAKSSSASTRLRSLELYGVLVVKCKADDTVLRATIDEVLSTLKGGKTSSPDQRASLFAMLSATQPTGAISKTMAEDVAEMLAKETQETSMRSAMIALNAHLGWCLANNVQTVPAVGKAVCKELNNAKVPLRKAVCVGVGAMMMQLPADPTVTQAAKTFGESLLAGLEGNLKTASTNTLTSPSGPLEGYVAVAVLEGRMAYWESALVASFCQKDAVLQSLTNMIPKPAFLLNDKVIRKLSSTDEEVWLLHAIVSIMKRRAAVFHKEKAAQTAACFAFTQMALSSSESVTRKAAVSILQGLTAREPGLAAKVVQQGLTTWFGAQEAQLVKADAKAVGDAEEDTSNRRTYSRELKGMLLAVTMFDDGVNEDVRFDTLRDLFVIAHHPELGSQHRQCFVELCKNAQVNPETLVAARIKELLDVSREGQRMAVLRQAAFASLSTLVLVAPEEASLLLSADIHDSIRADEISALTTDDLGIWQTHPEALFVDILAKRDTKTAVDRNRKDASLEQWDAELREAIARKKAAQTKTLTREEKAAVDAQMDEERRVRARVSEVQTRLIDALRTMTSIVEARAAKAVEDKLTGWMSLLLRLAAIPQTSLLAGDALHQALLCISLCCSDRLGDYAQLIRVALLRSVNPELVDVNFQAEPLHDLTLRILYRLRLICDQNPLDLVSVAFVQPLISTIISQGGLGLTTDDTDGATEQVQLALDFITFHGPGCRDSRFPRIAFVDDLVRIVSTQTQLAKDAVGTLRSLGEAMKMNASANEIDRLLFHTLADEAYVRAGSLQALQPLDMTEIDFCVPLWLACHDDDEENGRLALKAWEENGLDVPTAYRNELLAMLEHKHTYVRLSAARSLAAAAELHPETTSDLLAALRSLYEQRNEILAPQYDRFGMVIEETLDREDPWQIRGAVALAFQHLAPHVPTPDLVPFYEFLIGKEALGDRSEDVRQKMLDAGTTTIDMHGEKCVSELISMFESFLQHPAAETNDDVTEAVIILFGRLARHLDAKDDRVSKVVDRLVDALKTPSELVQVAVTDCLPPLASAIGHDVPRIIEKLFKDLLYAPKYAERRGAAYGLAGLIKGRGIASIAEFNVMARLAQAVEDKKNTNGRQGTMMAYETLIATLQRLFEPYIPQILPQLLTCFGDSSKEVQEATQETSRVIMQNISGYGVKLIMPSLLSGLDEKQWRTKKGAIELLGAMAYCAPRQLSHFLPTIIPHLSEPIKDSHTQVRQSAERALKGFGDVISNPEVKQLVPVIMKALIDPNAKTAVAQRAILAQKWIHVLDGPSLALIIPVIDRGLRERGAQVQKDAARIVGNLASLTDSKDFVPYLETLEPLIRNVLVSPVPDARSTAAKALGTLVERLGEINFVELVPSLLAILKSDKSGVDRQGSAQGLAEVLAGLGIERMEALLPDIINNASSASRATVRESHILLLIYLPATFGLRFSPHLGRIIPPILGGIADDSESVREASMRAGRMIIANYSSKAVDLLLPELEVGMFDDSWRIRHSSIQLISDLLFRLSGVSGNNEVEDEGDEEGAEQNIVAGHSIQKSLAEALGAERRDNLFAALYILRQDSIINVRQAAINVWKALVNNTPRMAREILGLLVDMIIKLLAQSLETREMAGRALGELTSKLGERILAESIPMLEAKSAEADEDVLRAGVSYAVTEILNNSTDSECERLRVEKERILTRLCQTNYTTIGTGLSILFARVLLTPRRTSGKRPPKHLTPCNSISVPTQSTKSYPACLPRSSRTTVMTRRKKRTRTRTRMRRKQARRRRPRRRTASTRRKRARKTTLWRRRTRPGTVKRMVTKMTASSSMTVKRGGRCQRCRRSCAAARTASFPCSYPHLFSSL